MIAFLAGVKASIAGGATDIRCGTNSLALKVQQGPGRDPHGGDAFCFRGRKDDLIKVLWQSARNEITPQTHYTARKRLICAATSSGFSQCGLCPWPSITID
ncbi:IS66 family insertion sequence element accessory protein TnpB [Rhizobium sp. HT1-10]|uniref:IS66 family insertion sequence element accessory protein TnpB n=1 Tax=Rhizobium sp. HT1-10 TaxID=3111638 RepID=UPI003C2D32E9